MKEKIEEICDKSIICAFDASEMGLIWSLIEQKIYDLENEIESKHDKKNPPPKSILKKLNSLKCLLDDVDMIHSSLNRRGMDYGYREKRWFKNEDYE